MNCWKRSESDVSVNGAEPHGDPIWEHKKGRVWLIVQRQEREIKALRYQNRVLQARLRGLLPPFADIPLEHREGGQR